MQKKFFSLHADFFGFSASMLCAVHCAIWPVLIAVGAFGGLSWLTDDLLEWFFIGLTLVIAAWSLLNSYFKVHRNPVPLLIVVSGFGMLIFNHLLHNHHHHHTDQTGIITAVLGGLLIALAHYINWRMLDKCTRCSLDDTP